jgi:hypothetical protein
MGLDIQGTYQCMSGQAKLHTNFVVNTYAKLFAGACNDNVINLLAQEDMMAFDGGLADAAVTGILPA